MRAEERWLLVGLLAPVVADLVLVRPERGRRGIFWDITILESMQITKFVGSVALMTKQMIRW